MQNRADAAARDQKGGFLVIGPAWVGDMVMAQSLFITLKNRYPAQPIDVVAPAWSLPLLARMPEVRRGIELPVGHGELKLSQRLALGRSLRGAHYHQAIVLPRSFKSALIPWAAKIPHRVGFRGEMRYGLLNDIRPFDKALLARTVQRYVALGQPRGEALPPPTPYPELSVDSANQRVLIEKFGLSVDRPIVALLPGAEYGPAKRWPSEYFAALANQLNDKGYVCWVFGSKKEQELGAQIASGAEGGVVNLVGRTELVDVIDLMALCSHAVTNDSGLMHIAAAVGIQVVAIYGSSSPDYTPPLTKRATIHVLELACSPCFERDCRFGHNDCLRRISVDQVAISVYSSLH
ncbi:MAG: lipopolysaccharide heptosyltransferase II [Gammaproteobacteria bacterium]